MPAAKGTQPKGGSRKGKPNKATAQLKDMILGALDDAGGRAYLSRQAEENPKAFLSLVGRVLPIQVNAKVDAEHTTRYVSDQPMTPEEWQAQHAPVQ